MYAMGRFSRRASAGVRTIGLDAMTYGSARPSLVVPIDPVAILAPSVLSESINRDDIVVVRRLGEVRSLGARERALSGEGFERVPALGRN